MSDTPELRAPAVVRPSASTVRWPGPLAPFGRAVVRMLPETLALIVAYAAYTVVRDLVVGSTAAAVSHGRAVLDAERAVHLDPEHAFNRFFAAHHTLAVGSNYGYAMAHFVVTIAVMVAVYRWAGGRARARRLAGIWYLTNLIGLAVFWLWPVAPPRLLPGSGFIDTLVTLHTSVGWGSPAVQAASNQYAAMPSLHLAWAAWCTVAVFALTRRTWPRVLALVYPVVIILIVLGTANHYLLDTFAGVATTGLAMVLVAAVGGLARFFGTTRRHDRTVQEAA